MKSIAFPAHVAVLFRRIVNVVSTLSISNHYFRNDDNKFSGFHHLELTEATMGKQEEALRRCRWESLAPFNEQWDNVTAMWNTDRIDQASSVSLPWWPTLFSSSRERPSPPSPLPPENPEETEEQRPPTAPVNEQPDLPPHDIIHRLLTNPALSDPTRTPRYPIVLCHGLYGFDTRGPPNFPSMRMHYWANVLQILRGKLRAEVIITSVPGTGNISSRSARLDEQLKEKARGRGINMLAHSMGGLDCRHLITHIKPSEYVPLSLMSVSTPHRGSPFMDWCVDNIGIGKLNQQEPDLLQSHVKANEEDESQPPPDDTGNAPPQGSSFNFASLPSSFTTLLLSVVDSPAYANLTSAYLNDVFNPATPDDPNVKYWSVAGRVPSVSVFHPFWFTKMIVDDAEEIQRMQMMQEQIAKHGLPEQYSQPSKIPLWADEREWGNDGLVTVQSAKWGEFLGVLDGSDHWEMRGARGIEFGVDLPAIPAIGLSVSKPSEPVAKPTSKDREWGKFLTGWKRDDKTAIPPSARSQAIKDEPVRQQPHTIEERQADLEKRESEYQKGDQVVRNSTDRLSVVFDWLVEQIPAPQVLASAGKMSSSILNAFNGDKPPAGAAQAMEGKVAAHTVGSSSIPIHFPAQGASPYPPNKPDALRAEVKKMAKRERKRWMKNELGTKAELERFYIALSRKMWDEGL